MVRHASVSPLHRRTVSFNVPDLRAAGATMLGAAALLPLLPGHPGFACPLRTLTGIPCPLCGMTTSVEATMQGHLADAVTATPAGIVAVAVALWLLIRPPRELRVSSPTAILGLLAMWLFQLERFGSFSL